MKKKIHSFKYLKDRRKDLRKNLTSAEATLWKSLQRKQLKGRKFRRQHSVLNFIVDFYCPNEKLIVELDGAVHFEFSRQNYDNERTEKLELEGFTIIRFENKEVFENLEFVLGEIANNFED